MREPRARRSELTTPASSARMWCIHPSQIAIANDVFAPTERKVAEAEQRGDV